MEIYCAFFISYLLAITTLFLNNKKSIQKKTLLISLIVTSFFLFVIVFQFYVIKFNQNIDKLLFIDEYTYLYETYELGFFGILTKIIYQIGGISLNRCINFYFFTLGYIVLLENFDFRQYEKFHIEVNSIFLVVLLSLYSYWVFFVLKEAYTFFSLSLYLTANIKKNKKIKYFAIGVMLLTRTNLFFCVFLYELITNIAVKSRKRKCIIIVIVCLIILIYFSSEYSYVYKLGLLARRDGVSEKVFDSIARVTAHKNAIGFFLSQAYWEAVAYNIKSSFLPWIANSIFIIMLILVNCVSVCIVVIKRNLNKKMYYLVIGIVMILLFTNASFRYINSIIIPFAIFYLCYNGDEDEKDESIDNYHCKK